MVTKTSFLTGRPVAPSLPEKIASKAIRHTLGRIDSVVRVAVGALLTTLQLAKIALKGIVCVLTLGQLKHFKLTQSFGVHGLLVDSAMLFCLAYKTMVIGGRDIIVAPSKQKGGYVSAAEAFCAGLYTILHGNYHMIDYSKTITRLMNGAILAKTMVETVLKHDPFCEFTDTQTEKIDLTNRKNVKTEAEKDAIRTALIEKIIEEDGSLIH